MQIAVLLLDQFADWEAAYLSSGLRLFGHDVMVRSPEGAPVRSLGGFAVQPDGRLDGPADFDGLALIGGTSWRTSAALAVEPLVRRTLRENKVLGAICDAAGFLGTLGVLNGVRHTCNDLADLRQWAGERYGGEACFLPRPAVRDGTLVTANGTAALEFAREFLLALDAAPEVDILRWYQFHKLGYAAPLPGM